MTLLLKNRKYIGDYCYGDMIIPGGVPALVEKDVFERVQRRMEANKKSPGRAKAKEEYLLSGKVFCGTCGGHMVGECGKSRNGTFYYYYKCINAKHGHTCKRKALKRDWLERAVVVETVTKVLTDEVIDRVADAIIAIQGQENPMIPSIKGQLRACDKGLKKSAESNRGRHFYIHHKGANGRTGTTERGAEHQPDPRPDGAASVYQRGNCKMDQPFQIRQHQRQGLSAGNGRYIFELCVCV